MHINVRIEGVTPLLCNRFTDEAAQSATSGSRASAAAGDRGTPREQAEKKLYTGQDGKPVIPQPNIFKAIIEGGRFFKAGKKQITTQKSSMIPACVEMNEVEYPIAHQQPWETDTRAVRIPSSGARILCHRPCFHDWALDFELELDTEIMDVKLLRSIVDAAGKRIGLGDFRPDNKGPFGKFVVTKWEANGNGKA